LAKVVYRLFEELEVELSGKHFIAQDASCVGMHTSTDAISLEISDAVLYLLDRTYYKKSRRRRGGYHCGRCQEYAIMISIEEKASGCK
jgi:hypothetical protein